MHIFSTYFLLHALTVLCIQYSKEDFKREQRTKCLNDPVKKPDTLMLLNE